MSNQETWTDNRGPRVVLNYDERGICEVDRGAMHTLLRIAGFTIDPAQDDARVTTAADVLRTHKITGIEGGTSTGSRWTCRCGATELTEGVRDHARSLGRLHIAEHLVAALAETTTKEPR